MNNSSSKNVYGEVAVKYFAIFIIIISLSLYSYQALSTDYSSKVYASNLYQLEISREDTINEFSVELVYTGKKMRTGLMNRKMLDKKSGMLFLFGKEEIIKMWMKNTYIPLDMIFIDKNGEVVNFVTNTIPESLKVISSILPAQYVLELNAGAVKNSNIQKGDKVNIEEITQSLTIYLKGLKEKK